MSTALGMQLCSAKIVDFLYDYGVDVIGWTLTWDILEQVMCQGGPMFSQKMLQNYEQQCSEYNLCIDWK